MGRVHALMCLFRMQIIEFAINEGNGSGYVSPPPPPGQKLAIVSDSEYLIIGAQGKVQQWQGMARVGGGVGPISNVPVWEELLEEIERPDRELRWIYVPGHAGMEGNETAHRLSVEGMCLSGMWAQSRKSFATERGEQHPHAPEQSPEPQGHGSPVPETSVVQEHMETGLHCEDPGSIWLSLGLIEMSEPDTEGDNCGGGDIDPAQVRGLQLVDSDSEGVADYGTDASDGRKRVKRMKLAPSSFSPH